MNIWEKACKEFLKGCTCVDIDKQEDCKECLKAFCDHLRSLAIKENIKTNEYCIGIKTLLFSIMSIIFIISFKTLKELM